MGTTVPHVTLTGNASPGAGAAVRGQACRPTGASACAACCIASTASRSQALRPRGSGTCASAQARPSLLTHHVQPVPLHVFLRPACPSTLTPSRGPQPGSGRTPRPHIHLRLSLHLPPGSPQPTHPPSLIPAATGRLPRSHKFTPGLLGSHRTPPEPWQPPQPMRLRSI